MTQTQIHRWCLTRSGLCQKSAVLYFCETTSKQSSLITGALPHPEYLLYLVFNQTVRLSNRFHDQKKGCWDHLSLRVWDSKLRVNYHNSGFLVANTVNIQRPQKENLKVSNQELLRWPLKFKIMIHFFQVTHEFSSYHEAE